MSDTPETIELTMEEYVALHHKATMWDFYCANAEFDVSSEEYDEANDRYVADPEGEIIIYTNKTLREENDFLGEVYPSTEECGECVGVEPCECCGECKGCCGEEIVIEDDEADE